MKRNDEKLGIDLMVTPYFKAHDAAEIDLVKRQTGTVRPVGKPAEVRCDLDVLSGRKNLAQALILRLLTPKGSLVDLGHREYGSRLHELIGKRKTEALRNLCRAYVLQVVAQEPRVEDKAVEFEFDRDSEQPYTFVFTLAVKPRTGGDALTLSLEVEL